MKRLWEWLPSERNDTGRDE